MGHQTLNASTWDALREIFEDSIPFNKYLDVKVEGLEFGNPKLILNSHEFYVGNFLRGNLHGGVISSVLDIIGGIVAFSEVVRRNNVQTTKELLELFSRTGTIDIRIDYLRPGLGEKFIASAYVLRTGRKVAVTRMELHNCDDLLIAVGTGAYVIS